MKLAKAATVLSVLGLLHIHIHLHPQLHGPPFDYVGLSLGAAASWIGLPGPGEPLLIYAGVLAARHQLNIAGVVFVAWIAATIGGVLGWLIGLKAGNAVLTAPGPLYSLRVGAVRRGERIFERHAVLAILLTPAWVAGIHRVRSKVYQPINAISAAVWAAGLGFGGYVIGPTVIDLFDDVGIVAGIFTAVLIVSGVAFEVRRRRRRRRQPGETAH